MSLNSTLAAVAAHWFREDGHVYDTTLDHALGKAWPSLTALERRVSVAEFAALHLDPCPSGLAGRYVARGSGGEPRALRLDS